jgi:protein-tyrosine phosphatase
VTVGLYCQAGISRTSTVAIAYLLVRGVPLEEANRAVREARPQAMPALELWRSLERIAAALAGPRT